MTVRRLLAEIDSRELSEWMAYDRLEPFGERRADLRMAILASVTAAAGGAKNPRAEDFMPDFEPRPQKTWQQQRDQLRAATMALNGR